MWAVKIKYNQWDNCTEVEVTVYVYLATND